jgi:3-oxoacyl-[acyl-carrier protein] reductase
MAPDGLLSGKCALVTGAGRGIGRAVGELFAQNGARVAFNYHSRAAQTQEAAARFEGSVAVAADLTDASAVNSMVEQVMVEFGQIDILVNAASSFANGVSFLDDSWEAYTQEWNGVVGTTFHAIKAVAPHMVQRRYGRIVNFAAALVKRPTVNCAAHIATKSAIIGFSRALAKELGPHNVTVNVISPGMTLTEFSSSLPSAERDRIAAVTPLRRLATPGDVANLALFFASDLSGFVTGAEVSPDGGLVVL